MKEDMDVNDDFTRGAKPSLFATALKGLFDDTNFYTRDEWLGFLFIWPPQENAIDLWLSDKALPYADRLRMILDVLENSTGVTQEPLIAFKNMLEKPAAEISPFADKMGATLSTYLERRGMFFDEGRFLRGKPPEEQAWSLRHVSFR
jgi:hypothetical protein